VILAWNVVTSGAGGTGQKWLQSESVEMSSRLASRRRAILLGFIHRPMADVRKAGTPVDHEWVPAGEIPTGLHASPNTSKVLFSTGQSSRAWSRGNGRRGPFAPTIWQLFSIPGGRLRCRSQRNSARASPRFLPKRSSETITLALLGLLAPLLRVVVVVLLIALARRVSRLRGRRQTRAA